MYHFNILSNAMTFVQHADRIWLICQRDDGGYTVMTPRDARRSGLRIVY